MTATDEFTVAIDGLSQLAPLELIAIDSSHGRDTVLELAPANRQDCRVSVYLINARVLSCDLGTNPRFGKIRNMTLGKVVTPIGASLNTLQVCADAGHFLAAFGRLFVSETSLNVSAQK